MKKLMALCSWFMVFSLPLFAQETLTLTTYYPAPFGVYQRLVTQTLGVGDNNPAVAGIDATDAPNPTVADQAGDVWIAGDVGIGTTNPQEKLDITGGSVITDTIVIRPRSSDPSNPKEGEIWFIERRRRSQ